jgi:GNAT superfamily N-acetyltransferase
MNPRPEKVVGLRRRWKLKSTTIAVKITVNADGRLLGREFFRLGTLKLMNQAIQVWAITAAQTVPLRAEVLRPGRPVETAVFTGDEDEQNRHFGVFIEGQLVGVASLFRAPLPQAGRGSVDPADGPEWQLRGMAVRPLFQKSGLGRELLRGCMNFVYQEAESLLWCNARSSAVGFYLANGFETRGNEFLIPDVGPHFVMVYRP